jgi:DNA repair exonuclease SbcCD ATPase subunit
MAELIELGADDLKASLDSVDDSKIIDKEEVDKAKNYRAAMDNLRDSFEKMAIQLGERLIPKVAELLELLAKLPELMRGAGGVVEDVFSDADLAKMGNEAAAARIEFKALADMYGGYYASRVQGAKDDTYELEQQMLDLEEATSATDAAFEALKNELKLEGAVLDAREQLDRLAEKAIEAFNGADGALSEYEQGLIDAQLMVLNLAETIALTDAQKNQIRVLVDTGQLEQAVTLIDRISSGGRVSLIEENRFARRANGGPVNFGSSYIVGERGPELFTPSSSGNITPNHAMGGGSTITVNVNGGDPDAVVRAIQKYARQNGAIPLQTTTSARF